MVWNKNQEMPIRKTQICHRFFLCLCTECVLGDFKYPRLKKKRTVFLLYFEGLRPTITQPAKPAANIRLSVSRRRIRGMAPCLKNRCVWSKVKMYSPSRTIAFTES